MIQMILSTIKGFFREHGESFGAFTLIAAIVLLFITMVLTILHIPTLIWLGIVLGLFSLGLGATALGSSAHSDKRMQAIADLEFDEKLATMSRYLEEHQRYGRFYDDVYFDIRATLRLEKWASDQSKKDFKEDFQKVIDLAGSKGINTELAERFKKLWKEYGIDLW